MFEIETSEPTVGVCGCCGSEQVSLVRFVYRDGDAYAIYKAFLSFHEAVRHASMIVFLGEFGEGTSPADRVAVGVEVRMSDPDRDVALVDVDHSFWTDVERLGKPLSAAAAIEGPWRAAAVEIVEHALLADAHLAAYLSLKRSE